METGRSTALADGAAPQPPPVVLDGRLNPAFFRHLQAIYAERTGYHLVLADLSGAILMGLPDCEKFPCLNGCRDCREQLLTEALRTGRVCLDRCHEGYVLWGLPYVIDGRVAGGLIVIGGAREGQLDQRPFARACAELQALARQFGLVADGPAPAEGPAGDARPRVVLREAFVRLRRDLEVHGGPLINALQSAEFATAERHFEGIKLAFRREAGLPLDLLKGLAGDLVFRARQQLSEAGLDAYACYAEAGLLMEQISATRSAGGIENVLDAFFARFIHLSRQRPKDPDDLLIQRAVTYMERNIAKDLTRETVARAVGISPSHFSRLIRDKKGRTFIDLLNQYRIEHACKLLVRTSKTLAEIAHEAGFCDQSYFSKVFRRYKGLSPAGFRQEHHL